MLENTYHILLECAESVYKADADIHDRENVLSQFYNLVEKNISIVSQYQKINEELIGYLKCFNPEETYDIIGLHNGIKSLLKLHDDL